MPAASCASNLPGCYHVFDKSLQISFDGIPELAKVVVTPLQRRCRFCVSGQEQH